MGHAVQACVSRACCSTLRLKEREKAYGRHAVSDALRRAPLGGWRLRSEAAVWNGILDSDTHTPANTSLVKALFEAEADRCRVN